MGQVDVKFDGSIFRKDHPMIVAAKIETAKILPVRLRYNSSGYKAGTLIARNTTDGFYDAYDDNASSGLNTAAAVLFEAYDSTEFSGTASTDSTLARGIFGGCILYKDKLTGYDANGLVDLKGTIVIDATGVNLLSF